MSQNGPLGETGSPGDYDRGISGPIGVKDTLELIDAIFLALLKYKQAKDDDGKVSRWETIGISVALIGPLVEAGKGIQNVLNELLTSSQVDQALLTDRLSEGLISLGMTHRTADISSLILDRLIEDAQLAKEILEKPPTAEPVTE